MSEDKFDKETIKNLNAFKSIGIKGSFHKLDPEDMKDKTELAQAKFEEKMEKYGASEFGFSPSVDATRVPLMYLDPLSNGQHIFLYVKNLAISGNLLCKRTIPRKDQNFKEVAGIRRDYTLNIPNKNDDIVRSV